jgi:hypothetical protein
MQEIKDGATMEERHKREKKFFSTSAPWTELKKDRTGIEAPERHSSQPACLHYPNAKIFWVHVSAASTRTLLPQTFLLCTLAFYKSNWLLYEAQEFHSSPIALVTPVHHGLLFIEYKPLNLS